VIVTYLFSSEVTPSMTIPLFSSVCWFARKPVRYIYCLAPLYHCRYSQWIKEPSINVTLIDLLIDLNNFNGQLFGKWAWSSQRRQNYTYNLISRYMRSKTWLDLYFKCWNCAVKFPDQQLQAWKLSVHLYKENCETTFENDAHLHVLQWFQWTSSIDAHTLLFKRLGLQNGCIDIMYVW